MTSSSKTPPLTGDNSSIHSRGYYQPSVPIPIRGIARQPKAGYVILVDGAVNPLLHCIAAGYIGLTSCNLHLGSVSFCGAGSSSIQAEILEILAIRLAVLMAMQWRLVMVTILSDAQVIVKALQSPPSAKIPIRNYVLDVVWVVSSFHQQGPNFSLHILYSLTESVVSAHMLARRAARVCRHGLYDSSML